LPGRWSARPAGLLRSRSSISRSRCVLRWLCWCTLLGLRKGLKRRLARALFSPVVVDFVRCRRHAQSRCQLRAGRPHRRRGRVARQLAISRAVLVLHGTCSLAGPANAAELGSRLLTRTLAVLAVLGTTSVGLAASGGKCRERMSVAWTTNARRRQRGAGDRIDNSRACGHERGGSSSTTPRGERVVCDERPACSFSRTHCPPKQAAAPRYFRLKSLPFVPLGPVRPSGFPGCSLISTAPTCREAERNRASVPGISRQFGDCRLVSSSIVAWNRT
jgi:hypothetical protein